MMGGYCVFPAALLRDHSLSAGELRVIGALLSFVRWEHGRPVPCWPSRAAIGERCGYQPKMVTKMLAKLERRGYLRREYRQGSTIYHFPGVALGGQRVTIPDADADAAPALSTADNGGVLHSGGGGVPHSGGGGYSTAEEAAYSTVGDQKYTNEDTNEVTTTATVDLSRSTAAGAADKPKRTGRHFDLTALPDDWRQWAVSFAGDGVAFDVDAVWAEFADYWVAVPGAAGRKADWFATWRNRVRTVIGREKKQNARFDRNKRPNVWGEVDRYISEEMGNSIGRPVS